MSGRPPRWVLALGAVASGVVVCLWLAVSWIEAEREVRILCGTFDPGESEAEVLRTLRTGNYLRWTEEGTPTARVLRVSSRHTLGTAVCRVSLDGDTVTAARYRSSFP